MAESKDKKALLAAAAAEVKIQMKLKAIFAAWGNLESITIKLGDFMGLEIPSQTTKGVSLYSTCLVAAINKYDQCSPQQIGTTYQMYAFIDGLLERVPEILQIHVATTGKARRCWEPFDVDIASFIRENEKIEIINKPYCKVNAESVRLMVLSRIITFNDLQWLDEGKPVTKLFDSLSNESFAAH